MSIETPDAALAVAPENAPAAVETAPAPVADAALAEAPVVAAVAAETAPDAQPEVKDLTAQADAEAAQEAKSDAPATEPKKLKTKAAIRNAKRKEKKAKPASKTAKAKAPKAPKAPKEPKSTKKRISGVKAQCQVTKECYALIEQLSKEKSKELKQDVAHADIIREALYKGLHFKPSA